MTAESTQRLLATLTQLGKQCTTLASLVKAAQFRAYGETSTLDFDAAGTTLRSVTVDLALQMESDMTKLALCHNNFPAVPLSQDAADRLIKAHLPMLISFLKTFPHASGTTLVDTYHELGYALLRALGGLAAAVHAVLSTSRDANAASSTQQRVLGATQHGWNACRALKDGPRNNTEAVRQRWSCDVLPLLIDARNELREALASADTDSGHDSSSDLDFGVEGATSWSEEKRALAEQVATHLQVAVQVGAAIRTGCLTAKAAPPIAWLDTLVPQGRALSDQADETVALLWSDDSLNATHESFANLQRTTTTLVASALPHIPSTRGEHQTLVRAQTQSVQSTE
ncbi:hypothetical protein H4R34_001559 [Dimargaris verticillata]|uniref:Cyclin-D1-binding protein 1-like N-terminal domain-containing protein n=1 Tax=Dimargaris verticillata TaxID=2761393 RepID=A0A9W8B472_9FUNG|nr:hypothetical protein H4R34_001559 [Dimargaris verticillata]